MHVHRRNLSCKSGNDEEPLLQVFVDVEEPERPIHPALEYEVLVDHDDDEEDEDEEDEGGVNRASTGLNEKRDGNFIFTHEQESPPPPSASQDDPKRNTSRRIKLLLSFFLLLFSGTGTVVSMKLQAVPMYNYPNFLNLFCHFFYIPLGFLYIMIRSGRSYSILTPIATISKRPFMIMGALDCLASTMQLFASMYVPGNLLVLLPQAVIPCSMALSHSLLGERYHWRQYFGAVVVLVGLLVVLTPVLTYERSPDFYCEAIDSDNDCTLCQTERTLQTCMSHLQPVGDDDLHSRVENVCQWLPYQQATKKEEGLTLGWSLLLLSSAIPMTLSAMYKQAYVVELDPIYVNGWISIFQFFFALVVAVPAAWMTHIVPLDVPRNMWDGFLCFMGHGKYALCMYFGCYGDLMYSVKMHIYPHS